MKQLYFHYHMDIMFDDDVQNHHFTLKCIPLSDTNQKIENLKVDVYPNQYLSESNDSFHNACIMGHAPEAHQKFYFDVIGTAYTGRNEARIYEDVYKVGFYKYPTNITKPGHALQTFFASLQFGKRSTNFQKAMIIMEQLQKSFEYKKDVTNITTTAEQAMSLGCGVCQDYAHIFIALCKMAGIPARYVVGLLVGEGYSHAWVEIFEVDENCQDVGYWIGIDPTNNILVHEDHIKISNGRDYLDCIINQGAFLGGGTQHQTISVIVYEAYK